jgi:cation diffusion facilitator CzcD-associated flavoprotein CzcO
LWNPDAIVVGAGPAGLACAMTMRAAGLDVILLEKADSVGSVWRRHYDRLHLHTDRKHSGLPGMVMPRTYPLYPSREQLVEYLESYATKFEIRPVFNTTVSCIRRDAHNGAWTRAKAPSRHTSWSLQRASLTRHIVLHGQAWKPIEVSSSTAANIAIPRHVWESACW